MSLHKTTEIIKQFLKWGGISGGVLLTIFLFFRVSAAVKNAMFPKQPDPPTVRFGKIPAIPFGTSIVKGDFTYAIDTLAGTSITDLPAFPDRLKIYKIQPPELSLLNADKADRKAAALNFIDSQGKPVPHTNITTTTFKWQDDHVGLNRTLIMDIDADLFTFTTPYFSYAPILNPISPADEERAKKAVDGFLNNITFDSKDIDPEKTKTKLLSIRGGTLIPATSLSTAHIVSVDLYQKDIDKLAVFYPQYNRSTMHFLVAVRNGSFEDIVEASFYHQDITEESATYPIKTAQEAFEELKRGQGYIANYFGSDNAIAITDVQLGYYIGEAKQDYLMPIVVFQGKGEFLAYVSAIKNEWLAQ